MMTATQSTVDAISRELDILMATDDRKVTIVTFGMMGFPVAWQGRLKSYEVAPYAQYRNALKIVFQVKRKRHDSAIRFHGIESILIWPGWHKPAVAMYPDGLTDEGNGIQTGRSLACFDSEYMDIARASMGDAPTVDTTRHSD